MALRATRAGNVFTTHTPVEAAFDRFEPGLVTKAAEPFVRETGLSDEAFLGLGRRDPADAGEPFNMAYLAMRGSCHVNGVARLHGKVSQRLFQVLFPGWPEGEVPVSSVTNGVHIPTWHSEPANLLWSAGLRRRRAVAGQRGGGGQGHRARLRRAALGLSRRGPQDARRLRPRPPAAPVPRAQRPGKRPSKRRSTCWTPIASPWASPADSPSTSGPTCCSTTRSGFSRILRNAERPMQIVFAGKAHPDDHGGKAMVQRMVQFARRDDVREHVVFLEDYDMVLAQHFAAGVDVWINNPRRPAEACGTSGMKMLVNGGLNCSILDGWWDEAYAAGGRLGDRRHARAFRRARPRRRRRALRSVGARHRAGVLRSGPPWRAEGLDAPRAGQHDPTDRAVLQRSHGAGVRGAGLSAGGAGLLRRTADGAKLARELEAWSAVLDEQWQAVRFGRLFVHQAEQQWQFEIEAYLGDV